MDVRPLLQLLQQQQQAAVTVAAAKTFLRDYHRGKHAAQVATWSDTRMATWIESARSSLQRRKGHDYVVDRSQRHEREELEVQIVHLGTGRIQHGSRWSNGVHEFIEAREGLVPNNQNLTIASMAHPAFFGRYRHVYGVTGTAGEPVERQEVEATYGVDSFDVPPNRPCLRRRLPTRVVTTKQDLTREVLTMVQETQQSLKRPLLLLFLSIEDTVAFSKQLVAAGIKHNVLNELQQEDEDFIVFRAGQPGAVTIATNTAGRGTDIVLSPAARHAGGLRVAFTFFPENFRVECQGLGRAARQGDPGTAEIIMSLEDEFVRQLSLRMLLAGNTAPDITTPQAVDRTVEALYVARSSQIKALSQQRISRSAVEVHLFGGLQVFFTAIAQIKRRFERDAAFVTEFAHHVDERTKGAKPLPPSAVEQVVLHRLQQQWALLFTRLAEDVTGASGGGVEAQCLREFVGPFVEPLLQPNVVAAAKACRMMSGQ